MTTRFDIRGKPPATMLACLFSLWLLIALPYPGAAQADQGFTVTVDPLPSCQAQTPISGTATLIGFTGDADFYVEFRGDGDLLDIQAFEGHDGYRDGTYEWSVSSDLTASHDVLELSFALYNDELKLIRDETIALNPDCAQFPAEAPVSPEPPIQSPVTDIPLTGSPSASPASTSSPESGAQSLPAAETGDEDQPDVRLVFGFTAGTVLVLSALAFLDRRPEP